MAEQAAATAALARDQRIDGTLEQFLLAANVDLSLSCHPNIGSEVCKATLRLFNDTRAMLHVLTDGDKVLDSLNIMCQSIEIGYSAYNTTTMQFETSDLTTQSMIEEAHKSVAAVNDHICKYFAHPAIGNGPPSDSGDGSLPDSSPPDAGHADDNATPPDAHLDDAGHADDDATPPDAALDDAGHADDDATPPDAPLDDAGHADDDATQAVSVSIDELRFGCLRGLMKKATRNRPTQAVSASIDELRFGCLRGLMKKATRNQPTLIPSTIIPSTTPESGNSASAHSQPESSSSAPPTLQQDEHEASSSHSAPEPGNSASATPMSRAPHSSTKHTLATRQFKVMPSKQKAAASSSAPEPGNSASATFNSRAPSSGQKKHLAMHRLKSLNPKAAASSSAPPAPHPKQKPTKDDLYTSNSVYLYTEVHQEPYSPTFPRGFYPAKWDGSRLVIEKSAIIRGSQWSPNSVFVLDGKDDVTAGEMHHLSAGGFLYALAALGRYTDEQPFHAVVIRNVPYMTIPMVNALVKQLKTKILIVEGCEAINMMDHIMLGLKFNAVCDVFVGETTADAGDPRLKNCDHPQAFYGDILRISPYLVYVGDEHVWINSIAEKIAHDAATKSNGSFAELYQSALHAIQELFDVIKMRQGFGDGSKEYVDDFRAFFANLFNRGLLLALNSRPCNMQTKEAIVYSTMECHGEYHCGPLDDADEDGDNFACIAPNNTNSIGLVFSYVSASDDRVCESCKLTEKRQKTQGISPESDVHNNAELKTDLLDVARVQKLNNSDVFASLGPLPNDCLAAARFDLFCLRPGFHYRQIAEIVGGSTIKLTIGVQKRKPVEAKGDWMDDHEYNSHVKY